MDYYYLYNQSNNYFEQMDAEFKASVTHYGNTMDEGETLETQVALTSEGVPYLFDLYSGEVTRIVEYSIGADGRVLVDVCLQPDQSMPIVLAAENLLEDGLADAQPATVEGADLIAKDGALAVRAEQSGEYTVRFADGSEQTVGGEVKDVEGFSPWTLSITACSNKNDIGEVGAAASEMAYTVYDGITLDSLKGWAELGTVHVSVTAGDGTTSEADVNLRTLSGIGTYGLYDARYTQRKERTDAYKGNGFFFCSYTRV